MKRAEQKFIDYKGKQQYKRLTKGWEFCVRWKNGYTTWEKLSDFKECYCNQQGKGGITRVCAQARAPFQILRR